MRRYDDEIGPPVWTDEANPANNKEKEDREQKQHPPAKTLNQQKKKNPTKIMLSQHLNAEVHTYNVMYVGNVLWYLSENIIKYTCMYRWRI